MYRVGVLCIPSCLGGVGGHAPPGIFWVLRLSEVISGAFSDHNDKELGKLLSDKNLSLSGLSHLMN